MTPSQKKKSHLPKFQQPLVLYGWLRLGEKVHTDKVIAARKFSYPNEFYVPSVVIHGQKANFKVIFSQLDFSSKYIQDHFYKYWQFFIHQSLKFPLLKCNYCTRLVILLLWLPQRISLISRESLQWLKQDAFVKFLLFFVSGRDSYSLASFWTLRHTTITGISTYLVDKIFPVLNNWQLFVVWVYVWCKRKHGTGTPQFQLSESFSDWNFSLSSAVQFL